jgi:regulator of sirC expression with transglutaminase-like and TPR domain
MSDGPEGRPEVGEASPDSETPEAWAEATLRRVAGPDAGPLDLREGALALAVFDAPTERLEGYRAHLDQMTREVADAVGDDASGEGRLAALTHVLFGMHGYRGDSETYDDLQNANLIRVMDRRKGLPVALGILMIHLARTRGWDMVGLDFPGHFLIRLDTGGARLVVDPFHEGAVMDAAALRALLKMAVGQDAELRPEHYEPISDRDILLRLQNNIKLRLLRAQRIDEAAGVVDGMLLLAPNRPALWRESGLMNAHIGNVRTAIGAFDRYLDIETRPGPRQEIEALRGELRGKLN